MSKSKWILLAILGGALIGVIDYPSLSCPFVYDDLPDFALNPQIHSGLKNALFYNPFRALIYFSYWLQLQIAGEPAPASGFRIFNLFFHWLNGLLLIKLGLLLFPDRKWLPAIASFCFWLHPIFLEAVNLISGRFDLFATFFYLCALAFYLRDQQSLWTRLGFFLTLLFGLLSKEIVITLPLTAFLLSLFKAERPKWFLIWTGLAMGLIFILLRLNWPIVFAKTSEQVPAWHIYFLSQNWIFWFGVLKILFPIHLNFDYALSNHTILGILALPFNLTLFSSLIILSRRRQKLGWFFLVYPLLYLPLALIPLADPWRESRIYLNGIWLILAGSLSLDFLRQKRKFWTLSSFGIILLCLFLLGKERAMVWQSGESLWRDAVRKSPEKFRPVFNYANALRRKLELERAKQIYLWAQKIEPENFKVEENLFLIEQAQKYPEQIEQFKKNLQENF